MLFPEEEWTTLFKKNTPEALVLVPLSNLDPNTAYEFRVIVVNSNSISEPSKPSAVYKTQGNSRSFNVTC